MSKTKKKAATKTQAKKKTNFCEEMKSRPREYQTSNLAVRKFTWNGTVAIPLGEKGVDTAFNKNLSKGSPRPKVEQTVSLNADGHPDVNRLQQQVKDKGSRPID